MKTLLKEHLKLYFDASDHKNVDNIVNSITKQEEDKIIKDFVDIDTLQAYLLNDKVSLNNTLKKLIHSYKSIPNLTKSLKILDIFIQNNSNIYIFTDNDNDGTISYTMSSLFVSSLNIKNNIKINYISKNKDTVGISLSNIKDIVKNKEEDALIVIIDSGTNSNKEIKEIKKEYPNLEFLIIDHHIPSSSNNTIEDNSTMIINPKLNKDNSHYDTNLSGSALFYIILEHLTNYNPNLISDKEIFLSNTLKLGKIANLLDSANSNFLLLPKPKEISDLLTFAKTLNIINNILPFITHNNKDFYRRMNFSNFETVIKDMTNLNKQAFTLISLLSNNKEETIFKTEYNYLNDVKPYLFLNFIINNKEFNIRVRNILNLLTKIEKVLKRNIYNNKNKFIEEFSNNNFKIIKIKNTLDFFVPLKFLNKIFFEDKKIRLALYHDISSNTIQGNIISKSNISDILNEKELSFIFNSGFTITGHDNVAGILIKNKSYNDLDNIIAILEEKFNLYFENIKDSKISNSSQDNITISQNNNIIETDRVNNITSPLIFSFSENINIVKKLNSLLHSKGTFSYQHKVLFYIDKPILLNNGVIIEDEHKHSGYFYKDNTNFIFNNVNFNSVIKYTSFMNKYTFSYIKDYIPEEKTIKPEIEEEKLINIDTNATDKIMSPRRKRGIKSSSFENSNTTLNNTQFEALKARMKNNTNTQDNIPTKNKISESLSNELKQKREVANNLLQLTFNSRRCKSYDAFSNLLINSINEKNRFFVLKLEYKYDTGATINNKILNLTLSHRGINQPKLAKTPYMIITNEDITQFMNILKLTDLKLFNLLNKFVILNFRHLKIDFDSTYKFINKFGFKNATNVNLIEEILKYSNFKNEDILVKDLQSKYISKLTGKTSTAFYKGLFTNMVNEKEKINFSNEDLAKSSTLMKNNKISNEVFFNNYKEIQLNTDFVSTVNKKVMYIYDILQANIDKTVKIDFAKLLNNYYKTKNIIKSTKKLRDGGYKTSYLKQIENNSLEFKYKSFKEQLDKVIILEEISTNLFINSYSTMFIDILLNTFENKILNKEDYEKSLKEFNKIIKKQIKHTDYYLEDKIIDKLILLLNEEINKRYKFLSLNNRMLNNYTPKKDILYNSFNNILSKIDFSKLKLNFKTYLNHHLSIKDIQLYLNDIS